MTPLRFRTTQWALALDHLPAQFVKRGESHFCVAPQGATGVRISYPISIYTHPNSSFAFFGTLNDLNT